MRLRPRFATAQQRAPAGIPTPSFRGPTIARLFDKQVEPLYASVKSPLFIPSLFCALPA